jgi:hypothetical protein
MQRLMWLLVVFSGLIPALAGERIIDFSQFPLDKPPAGFVSEISGGGKPADWKVILEPGAPPGTPAQATNDASNAGKAVLAQLSQDATDEHFPMLVLSDETYADFSLTTHFKIVDGLFEQMAGLAFRVQDTNNYYYVRASALGNTFRFIKVLNGQRLTTIGPSAEIPKGVWHELTIDCKGNRISCLLNGKELIPPLNDNSFAAGKIAFWTKSDSIAYFGETKITYTPHETLAQILVREAVRKYPHLVGLKIYGLRSADSEPRIIASTHDDEVGRSGTHVEQDVITRDVVYYGKDKQVALVTMPLHDRNGDVAAAVRVVLQSFPGQTEENVLARARPVVKEMEKRIRTATDLVQ